MLACALWAGGCEGPSFQNSEFVTRAGGELALSGRRFRFAGANRYDLTSFPPGSGKFYCGNAYADDELDRLLGELRTSAGATVVRTWAFQSFALGGTDFHTIDRLIAGARAHGLRLILTLENEWKDCTEPDPGSADGRKSGAWFAGGYRAPLGSYPLSYRDWVSAVVTRYRDEPTVAMWQLMNEAESTDGPALLGFADDVASLVKAIDGHHLVSLGTIGSGQAGTAGAAYRALHALPAIDVVEGHDYNEPGVALPAALANDINIANSLGKPFLIGEAGIPAPMPMYPYGYAERAALFDAKIGAHWAAGTDGFLVWSFYNLKMDNHQGWDFSPVDEVAAVLKARAAE